MPAPASCIGCLVVTTMVQSRSCLATAVTLFMGAVALAQVTWTRAALLSPRFGHAIAFDGARGRAVLFGGNESTRPLGETWEWDGSLWSRRAPAVSPSPRGAHAMVYDAVRQRVLLFGGAGAQGVLGDTWQWDGNAWTQATPPASPPARSGHAMAYDTARGRVLLFGGGIGSAPPLGDTWEWDGTTWRQLTPAVSPAPRQAHRMAYDVARDALVLFGGGGGTMATVPTFDDTWEWIQGNWVLRTPGYGPRLRWLHGMTYDRARRRVLVFGGQDLFLRALSDAWEWDGTAWTERFPAHEPPARPQPPLVYDDLRNQVLLMGGGMWYRSFGDTWTWDGTDWTDRTPMRMPAGRTGCGLAHDAQRQRTVLFGGTNNQGLPLFRDTWEWDGTRWAESSGSGPSGRQDLGMAADPARGGILLFGGVDSTGELADTWHFDGTQWRPQAPAVIPPARYRTSLAADTLRGRLVMFGGVGAGYRAFADTWEWDGSNWTLRQPAVSPPARGLGAMAFDAARGRTVLFGGIGQIQTLSDTWEWDGTAWLQRHPTAVPTLPLTFMAYDAARERVVLAARDGTWEWDGTDWARRTPIASPDPDAGVAMAYDSARERIVLFGGMPHLNSPTPDLWEYGPVAPARWNASGPGCAGTSGTPTLAPIGPRPWLGSSFPLSVGSLAGNAAGILLVGASDTRWSGQFALPLDLTSLGLTGCTLWVSGEGVFPFLAQSGQARVNLSVCNCPELLGAAFFTQALAADPGANPAGLVLSNAGAGRIGGR